MFRRRFQVTRAPFFVVTDDAKPEASILTHTIYDANAMIIDHPWFVFIGIMEMKGYPAESERSIGGSPFC